ncbi:DUF2290 domain-containing protein [Rhizobium giardinii]|uniref:DUF2290 domain-containing protein n=1 Tax=Rhizobium giardinii TaxID=56731 RepID=UPI003D6DD86E
MSAPDFCRTLSNFCETLIENNLALGVQSHVVRQIDGGRSRVCWISNSPLDDREEESYLRTPDLELAEYLRCLRWGDYSLLLNDGALIQISTDFEGGEVVASRFCYIPCVVKFDLNEIQIDQELYPIEDFIRELGSAELLQRLCLRPPFRFELDPANVADDHALSHVHLGKSASRIPVSAAMCWDHFARFVFSNFYPDMFDQISPLLRFPPPYRQRTITDAHGLELHFAFNHAPMHDEISRPDRAHRKREKRGRKETRTGR